MKNSIYTLFLLALICFVSLQAQPYYSNSDSILLENVKVLTFTKDQRTTGRRNSPIPQLQCVGGSASSYYSLYPSVVQCTNVGSDGFDIQWKCEADLDSSVRFGQTTVSCEGYNHPEDPYILKGSCGLEYNLVLTEQGSHNKRNEGAYQNHYNHNSQPYYVDNSQRNFNWGNVLMFVIFGAIIVGLIKQCNQNASGGTSSSSSSYRPGYNPGHNPGDSYPGNYPPGCAPNTYGTTSGTTYPTYQPGFWSGFGTGGLLGYLMRPRASYNHYNTGYGAPAYRSGWNSTPSFGSSSSSTSSPRTASAFANTRRR